MIFKGRWFPIFLDLDVGLEEKIIIRIFSRGTCVLQIHQFIQSYSTPLKNLRSKLLLSAPTEKNMIKIIQNYFLQLKILDQNYSPPLK